MLDEGQGEFRVGYDEAISPVVLSGIHIGLESIQWAETVVTIALLSANDSNVFVAKLFHFIHGKELQITAELHPVQILVKFKENLVSGHGVNLTIFDQRGKELLEKGNLKGMT